MNVSVERLRVWLLAGAGLLVLVIAGFLGYAHYRAHRFLSGLPTKLGVDIQQQGNGVTFSQSVKGKTIYTIHAAKTVQRKDGKVTLQDVGIVLYGRGDGGRDRVDRIYGKEFEYDQNAGVVRAMGEVHLDLQAPAPTDAKAKESYASGKALPEGLGEDARLIHVKTSGLVFLQKLGVAATGDDLEFEFHGMTGHAHGADYNSDTGLLVLQSAVKVNGLKDGKPVVLTAGRAELDRQAEKAVLARAVYTVLGGDAGVRVAKADLATAFLRHDGSVEWAKGEGGVSLTDEAGGSVTAARGEVHLTAANLPETAKFSGAVRYVSEDVLRQAKGEAEEGFARFDRAGRLQRVDLGGGVQAQERVRGSAQSGWSERVLASKELELELMPGSGKRVELRSAKATGEARLTTSTPALAGAKAGHGGATSSALTGDVLTAAFAMQGGAARVKTVHGVGHTTLLRVSDTGAKQTSAGDAVDADFVMGAGGRRKAAGELRQAQGAGTKSDAGLGGAEQIATAVQQGHVVLTNVPAAKVASGKGVPGQGSGEQRATADKAVYDGSTEKMTLTGTVQVSDGSSVVWADRVVMEQQSGDAVAEGSVKASYISAGESDRGGVKAKGDAGAVHVLATRAELKHASEEAFFYGVAGRPARLWQGGSQVTAPVLQFQQKERRMVARGDAASQGGVVHAVFVNATATGAAPAAGSDASKSGELGKKPVRVASHEMTYSDVARRADFTGGVVVEDADGTMQSQQAVVFLQAVQREGEIKTGSVAAGAFMGGSVERVVASGRVEIVQPGRRASGEQLVYTAADGMFVMTGMPGMPPRMMDEARGAITGASLRFHAGDNSVVVLNGPDSGSGQRVRSETRVKQ